MLGLSLSLSLSSSSILASFLLSSIAHTSTVTVKAESGNMGYYDDDTYNGNSNSNSNTNTNVDTNTNAPFQDSDIAASLWHTIGQSKIGNYKVNDSAGYSIDTNAEGYILAIGAPHHDTFEGKDAGRVVVYQMNQNTNEWEKIGYELFGREKSGGDQYGSSVALSTTGEFLAVGAPYCTIDGSKEVGCVYIYEKSNVIGNDINDMMYEPLGYTIYGENSYDHFGYSLDIHEIVDTEEGSEIIQVAIGAPDAYVGGTGRVGKVYVYEFNMRDDNGGTEQWKKVGLNGIDNDSGLYVAKGSSVGSKFGYSVSLTLDNKMVAVGSPGASNGSGDVSLYTLDPQTNIWSQITGFVAQDATPGDKCGSAVSITLRGDYVAYGCPSASRTNPSLLEVGKVTVQKVQYDTTTESWGSVVVVDDLWGMADGDHYGSSVDMGVHYGKANPSGYDNLFLAIGAPNNYPNFQTKQKAGHVRVYHLKNGETWTKANLDIDGDSAFDMLGTSVAIAFDGTRVAAGAPGGDGYAEVYQLSDTAPPTFVPTPSPTLVPTAFHERKPTGEGGIGKGHSSGRGDGGGGDNTGRKVWLAFFFLVLIPSVMFGVFRTFVYWKARHDYNSNFRAAGDGSSDNDIAQPLPNHDLELTVTGNGNGNGNGSSTTSHLNPSSNSNSHDII